MTHTITQAQVIKENEEIADILIDREHYLRTHDFITHNGETFKLIEDYVDMLIYESAHHYKIYDCGIETIYRKL